MNQNTITAPKKDETRVMDDDRQKNIINLLEKIYNRLGAETFDEKILPLISFWIHDKYFSLETCMVILSEVTDVTYHEETIQKIFNGEVLPKSFRSNLQAIIGTKDYNALKLQIEGHFTEGIEEVGNLDENVTVSVNWKTQTVNIITNQKEGMDPKVKAAIEAVPRKLTVYDPALLELPRNFKIEWSSQVTSKIFTTPPAPTGATVKEIANYLSDAGFTYQQKNLEAVLSIMINGMIKKGFAEMKTDIDNKGFYYNPAENVLHSVKNVVEMPSIEDMMTAHRTLQDLTTFFEDNKEVLATVFKWGLMSEFSYAMKQAGNWMPWMYLKGASGSGKTTIAKIIQYIWAVPDAENNIGGSSFDTVARMGMKLRISCDPLVVNEPAGTFNRSSCVEMMKICVENTMGRGKFEGSYYQSIPCFSPVLFTANQYLPEDDALLRRFHVISFTYSQRKTEHEKKMFKEFFHVDSPQHSRLTDLSVFARFAAVEMTMDPSLILEEWTVVADELIKRFYQHLEVEIPEWLTLWSESESLDDFDDNQREDIRTFFVNEFNRERGQLKIVDPDSGYGRGDADSTLDDTFISEADDFESVNWSIVNARRINYIIPKESRNGTKYACFTQGLRKAISQHTDFCSDLKSIAELLGWKYQSVKFGKKVQKVVKVKFSDLMEFMYPNIAIDDEEVL